MAARRHRIALHLIAALAVAAFELPLAGQVLYGSLSGSLADPSGAPLAGAVVTATQEGTNLTRETITDDSGRFTLSNLPAGAYRVTVARAGFGTQTWEVPVRINRTARIDSTLALGNLVEHVSVIAGPAILQTDQGGLAFEFSKATLERLPLGSYRNFQRLYDLVPGTTPSNFQNAVLATPARALTTNVNGTARNSNNIRQDGAPNMLVWLPHHAAYIPPAETIEAVSISTNAFDPEQGFAGGAAVTVLTKSGTNDFRGSASALYDADRLKSSNFFADDDVVQEGGGRVMIGGTLGGPIRRGRVFFFGSYEGTIERTPRFARASVPTAELREGNFESTETTIFNPFTGAPGGEGRMPFEGNRIPAHLIDPSARRLLEMLPRPNRPGLTINYVAGSTQRLDRHQFDGRLTWNRSPGHHLWGKYGRLRAFAQCDQVFGAGGGPGLCDSGYGRSDTTVHFGTVGQTWTVGPTMVVDGTIGWTAMDIDLMSASGDLNVGLEVLGLPGTNGPYPYQRGVPAFFAGFTEFGDVLNWIPLTNRDDSYTASANVTRVWRTHEFRAGADVVRHELNHVSPEVDNPRGLFRFGGGVTAVPGGAAPTIYNQFAAFLLGLPTQVSKSTQFEEMTAREWQYALYVRDRWQVTNRLSAMLGVRIERFPFLRRADRGIERLDWSALDSGEGVFVLLGGRGGNAEHLGLRVSYPPVLPRAGLAYQLDDDTVLRGGYGLTVDPIPFARPLRGLYPLLSAQAFVSADPFTAVGRLQHGIPAIVAPPADEGRLPLPPTAAFRSPGPAEIRRAFIHSWNATLERRLPGDFGFAASYVGTATRNAMLDLDINSAGPGMGQTGRPLARYGRTAATTAWALGDIPDCPKCDDADYRALQVAIDRSPRDGTLIKGTYTLSRSMNGSSGGPFGIADDSGWAGLAWNHPGSRHRNYGPAGYDRTHVFAIGWALTLPSPQRVASVQRLLAGWHVSGLLQLASGTPFTVLAPGESLNAPGNQQVADRVGALRRTRRIEQDTPFYDPASWRSVGETRFGNEARNSVRGPGLRNVDVIVSRRFSPQAGASLDARIEVLNVFNSPRWDNPSSANRDVTSPRFLQITSSNQAFDRQIRLTVRYAF